MGAYCDRCHLVTGSKNIVQLGQYDFCEPCYRVIAQMINADISKHKKVNTITKTPGEPELKKKVKKDG